MRLLTCAALMLAANACLCQVAAKKRVAVFDFENAAVQSSITSSNFQTKAPNVGRGVSQLLVDKLVRDGNVTVVERTAIDKILAEQNLTASDRTERFTAARLGRLLGVDAIVLGTINHYDYDEKIKHHNRFFGSGNSPEAKYDISATVNLSTRLVSADTAEVVAVSEGVGAANRKAIKIDLRDSGARLVMASGVNSPVMNDAMEKAIAQLAAQLEPEIVKLPPRAPVVNGLVADVTGDQLVLNVGSRDGLKIGDRLQVLRAGKEIRDPNTGRVLMRKDTFLGEAVVTKVNENFSVARYEGQSVSVGDIATTISKQN